MANNDNADAAIKDDSPYPSWSDMDLDMWRVSRPMPDGSRIIKGVDGVAVCRVPYHGESVAVRDTTARRIEMMGDLYEALRLAVEAMEQANIDATRQTAVLSEFITPKPFPEGH